MYFQRQSNYNYSRWIVATMYFILKSRVLLIIVHVFQVFYSYSIGFVYILVGILVTGDIVSALKVAHKVSKIIF